MLNALATNNHHQIKTVCIGGINASNVQRVLFQTGSSTGGPSLNGVAVVSAIIAADDPSKAAQDLKSLIGSRAPFAQEQSEYVVQDALVIPEIHRPNFTFDCG
jgi:thiamine-phosphate diphosphorylase/hydroxyethylthiazole kinase